MKTIKLFIVLAICTAGLMFSTSSVWAHGEKSLEPFVRMRTIQWYDVAWSNKQVNVNDELVVTGKFHVA